MSILPPKKVGGCSLLYPGGWGPINSFMEGYFGVKVPNAECHGHGMAWHDMGAEGIMGMMTGLFKVRSYLSLLSCGRAKPFVYSLTGQAVCRYLRFSGLESFRLVLVLVLPHASAASCWCCLILVLRPIHRPSKSKSKSKSVKIIVKGKTQAELS